VSEAIISKLGGRVVPISLSDNDVSPFLLLAHHSHSYTPFDPIRAATTLFLPEGFPAHPHAGFSTLTCTIDGGLRHRDSEGLQMVYGDGDAQFMKAGSGTIHEEMWDTSADAHKRIEIYQLWLNSPLKKKFQPPNCKVLKSSTIAPVVTNDGATIKLICGEMMHAVNGVETLCVGPGNDLCDSPVAVMHLSIPPSSTPLYITAAGDSSFVVYVRQGSLLIGNNDIVTFGDYCVYRKFDTDANGACCAQITAGAKGLEALVMIGQPIKERVVWSGPFVESSENDYNLVASYFNSLLPYPFWDYKLSDIEWKNHCLKLDLQSQIKNALQREAERRSRTVVDDF